MIRKQCWSGISAVAASVFGAAALAGAAQPQPPSLASILVRIEVQPDGVQAVVDLGLDVWSVAPDRTSIEVRVSRAEIQDLRGLGYDPVVIDPDVYATWERIVAESEHRARGGPWTQYHNLDSANAMMADLQAAYPDIAALMTIGTSVEGRPILGLRISDDAENADPTEPAVFIVGCHHAREWISVEIALYLADRLLAEYGVDLAITSLINRGEIWIVPILNVDGYLYTEQVNRMWRKNRRNNGNGTFGIDLNRNYSYRWGGGGSSGNPGSNLYRGPFAFSEPETAAVRDLFAARSFIAGLTYHSYSQFVMSPWGYTTGSPRDTVAMEGLVADMATVINAQHSNPAYDYISGRWGVVLYIGSGIFVDWIYGAHGVMSAIIEARPRTSGEGGFLLPPEQILGTCVENYAGTLHMIETVFGPDTSPPGNFDGDVDVDLIDYDGFLPCLTGPGDPIRGFPLGCPARDLDEDGDVDLGDFSMLQNEFTG